MTFLAPPICHLAEIPIEDANALLIRWQHRMGACNRPSDPIWSHALFEHGEPVAVTIAATLIRTHTVSGIPRADALELARLCAARPTLTRVMLRLWRDMVLPAIADRHGFRMAISYQDAVLHTGATYRLDGWRVIGKSSSGTDQRSGRKGRSKVVWAWTIPEPASAP